MAHLVCTVETARVVEHCRHRQPARQAHATHQRLRVLRGVWQNRVRIIVG